MPDKNQRIGKSAQQLAQQLVDSAKSDIRNAWTGRSWSDVVGSVYSNGRSWASSLEGLKLAVNVATGGIVGQVASMTGLDKLGDSYSKTVLEQVWALLEDDIKAAAQDKLEGIGLTKGRMSDMWHWVRLQRSNNPNEEFEEKADAIKKRFAELLLRVANVKAIADKATFRYCDDVHAAMRELAHAELCHAEVTQNCDELITLLEAIKQKSNDALPDATRCEQAFKDAAARVVADQSTIQHKMHENFGITGVLRNPLTAYGKIMHSCSKEKCYGVT